MCIYLEGVIVATLNRIERQRAVFILTRRQTRQRRLQIARIYRILVGLERALRVDASTEALRIGRSRCLEKMGCCIIDATKWSGRS
jgi:hypothetical protein